MMHRQKLNIPLIIIVFLTLDLLPAPKFCPMKVVTLTPRACEVIQKMVSVLTYTVYPDITSIPNVLTLD